MNHIITLHPYSSLSTRGLKLTMFSFGGLSALVATYFALQGAWPIMGFMGLEVALAFWLLQHHRRQQRLNADVLTLNESLLRIEHVRRAHIVDTWQAPTAWTRLHWDESDETRCPHLYAIAHGKRISIGSFLNTADKRAAYEKLKSCLATPL